MKRMYKLVAAASIALAADQIISSIGGQWFSSFLEMGEYSFRNAAFQTIPLMIIISGISIAAAVFWLSRVSDQHLADDVLIIAAAYSIIRGAPSLMNFTLVSMSPGEPPVALLNLLIIAVQLITSVVLGLAFLKAFSRIKRA